VLVLSEFLTWLSLGPGFSLWKVASGIDIVLALLGIATVAIAAVRITGGALAVPPETPKWIGVVATTIVLAYVIESDNLGFGVFLGVLGALAMLAGAILAERPDLAGRVADAAGIDVERPAAQPPAGVGAGGYTPGAAPAPAADTAATVQPATGAGAAGGAGAGLTSGAGGAGLGAGAGGGAAGGAGVGGGPPAGWYPDPQGQARLRYWDGTGWTEQTSA
jgi:hypothetical protein